MQLANGMFLVTGVGEIKTKVKKWAATEGGEPVIKSDSKQIQCGTATDNSEFEGERTVFTFEAEPGTFEVGDAISGRLDHRSPLHILDVFVENGRRAIKPAKFVPEAVRAYNPNAPDPDVAYDAPQGVELTLADLTDIVRKLQQRVHALESKS